MTYFQNNLPLVSVIIPSYNTGKYIEKAIKSVLNQTYKNIEIIVVDDFSTDNSAEIIQKINDKKIKFYQNTENLGVSATRNRAIKKANGNWIAVLDADDWYSRERLEQLIKVGEQNNAEIVADNLNLIEDGDTEPWGSLLGRNFKYFNSIEKISAVNFILSDIPEKKGLNLGFTKPIFKRDFLINNKITYNKNLKVTQDFWFVMDCFSKGANYYLVNEPYYYYRSRQGQGIYSDKIERLFNEKKIIEEFCLKNKKFVLENKQILKALNKKERMTDLLFKYYNFIEAIKEGNLRKSISNFDMDLRFLWFTFLTLIKSILRRLNGNEKDYLKILFNS